MPDELATRCRDRLQSVLGIEEKAADALVASYRAAAGEQMLEQMAGSGYVPSTISAHRAELMLRTCIAEKRVLTVREVAVLLRVTDGVAGAVRREMIAVYEAALQPLLLAAALAESNWGRYKDGSGNSAAMLTLATTSAATLVEYHFRREGAWEGAERDGRTLRFAAGRKSWPDGVKPPAGDPVRELADLVGDVSDTANLVTLLLAFVTVFTSEVDRRREVHSALTKPSPSGFNRLGGLAVGLGVLTLGSVVALAPLVFRVIDSVGSKMPYQPELVIFAVAWVLLVALFGWQVVIAVRAFQRA